MSLQEDSLCIQACTTGGWGGRNLNLDLHFSSTDIWGHLLQTPREGGGGDTAVNGTDTAVDFLSRGTSTSESLQ